jgi:hypothetical protein
MSIVTVSDEDGDGEIDAVAEGDAVAEADGEGLADEDGRVASYANTPKTIRTIMRIAAAMYQPVLLFRVVAICVFS